MKRTAWRFVLGCGLLAPSGCLAPLTGALTVDAAPATSDTKAAKEAKLPTKESAELCVSVGADLEKNGFLADAVIKYEQARQLDAKYKSLAHRMAVLYDRIGEERKAMAEFDEALKRTPKDPDLLNDFGYCHYNRGRWADAEGYFRKALAQNEKHPRATINLGLTLAQQGKYDEAMQVFLKVNRPAEAKANVAFVLAAQGKKAEARKLYQEALALDPSLPTARQALAAMDRPADAPKPDAVVKQAGMKARPANEDKCAGGSCPSDAANLEPFVIERKPAAVK